VSDINTAAADGLKALDPKRPIREADIRRAPSGLVLEVEIGTRLPGGVLRDEARIVMLLDDPRRREAARSEGMEG
jgi:hypothetical protein